MQIAGYLKTSLIEWPGKITSVIFTQGCNFRCPFCHNRSLINQTARFPRIPEEQIFADLAERRKWVDGVVLTGGEPTLWDDLPDFLKKIKDLGFLNMIHTNGTRPETIASLLHCSIVDYVCLDLKGDFENYGKYIGIQKSNSKNQNENLKLKIKETIRLIVSSRVEYEFRTTVVPGLHDLESLKKLARQISNLCRDVRSNVSTKEPRWFLQQFSPKNCLDPKYKKIRPYSTEKLESFYKELQKILPGVQLRGIS